MRVRAIVAAALGTIAGAIPSCRTDTLECELDYECDLGQGKGRCEWTGLCAYPDDSCTEIGRRYGKSAGNLAGMCVTAEVAGSSDGIANTSAADDGLDTTEMPPPCIDQFYDDFEDGALHPKWRVYATQPGNEYWVFENAGTLQVAIPQGGNGAAGIQMIDPLPLANGRVELMVDTPPPSSAGIGIALGSPDLSTGLILLLSQFSASFVAVPDPSTTTFLDNGFDLDLTQTPWIDVEFRAGQSSGTATLRVSKDGASYTTLGSVGHQIPLDSATFGLYAADIVPGGAPAEADIRFGSVRICY